MNELKFTATHEWLKLEDQDAIVGITEHAQELLGDMVYVELPDVGKEVRAGEELGVVESVKAASDVYAPISGVITEVNSTLASNPAIVNSDPYQAGWLVKIKPSHREELNELLSAEDYQKVIAEGH